MNPRVRFSIDRGGTFTDVYAEIDYGDRVEERVLKLLSVDPQNYQDAPREGIRRVMEEVLQSKMPRNQPIKSQHIESIRMGTTVATNALLERQGSKFAFITTKGFKDVLEIGNQSRPDIFDLAIQTPDIIYNQVVEIDARVVLGKRFPQPPDLPKDYAITGELIYIEKPIDKCQVRQQLEELYHIHGIRSISVALIHGATYPKHEQEIGEIASLIGFDQISLSHQVMQMVKLVPRGFTTCADAYLTPHISKYISTFTSGFDASLLKHTRVLFMQSDGGLTDVDNFSGCRAILSGPAGGVIGYAMTSRNALSTDFAKASNQVVAFDMGGTSTDVSRYAGNLEYTFESITAGVMIQAPQLSINTVAAGGGSKLTYKSGLMAVGPESVGAHPGPVCYRKGGQLAVTDANLVLGRIVPKYFPHIFGEDERQPVDRDAALAAFEAMTKLVNESSTTKKSVAQVALGFIKIANEAMCRPIRSLTQMKGYDLVKHTLACFGGAGGQHACSIARALGIKKVFIHRYSGILSAYGIGLADTVVDIQEPSILKLNQIDCKTGIDQTWERLEQTARDKLHLQGFDNSNTSFEYFLNLRFEGTDTSTMISTTDKSWTLKAFQEKYFVEYKREFGFVISNRDIIIDDIRVRASGHTDSLRNFDIAPTTKSMPLSSPMFDKTSVYFENGWLDTPIYQLGAVARESRDGHYNTIVEGPCILLDNTSTILVEPHCVAYVSERGDVTIDILPRDDTVTHSTISTRVDSIQLALFAHRFMGIAEQMGTTLQRTAFSVNIKERLDFSCALFGPDGGLVANAPHIPVHLGAMQFAVRFQKDLHGSNLKEGDVLVSNHPQLAGGSHLPDITVITPCFSNGKIVFWVASRGHHADIGGISPGSMPPHSKKLTDEGVAIVSFKLVDQGTFQEAGIRKLLLTPSDPSNPMCKGTRNIADNLSDLRAQVAANQHGVELVHALIAEYCLETVQAYMQHVQDNAELAVRDMLREFCVSHNTQSVCAEDYMDDGTKIRVQIDIDRSLGTATIDFNGTGCQVYGNCNTPPAIAYSAIIYSLRALVGKDIPLNEGCLAPVKIHIPQGTILSPSDEAAVVGGNVQTSQRVVDVILKAFNACAASQGCMNNLTFGNEEFGYYETIAGGAGAGPWWHGKSGVHTHMTNTRITDPETLERRYPVLLREFSLRKGTGGRGATCGGDGVVRELEFLLPVTLSILSERRAFQPYGMCGGEPGARGQNLLISPEGLMQNLGGKNSVQVDVPKTRIRILTPGGGGYGEPPVDH